MRGGINVKINKDAIIEEMKNTDDMALVSAYLYAVNALRYGVDVLEKWDTAVRNHANLEKAHAKGYYEGLEELREVKTDIEEYRREHNCSCSDCLDIIDKHINGKENKE